MINHVPKMRIGPFHLASILAISLGCLFIGLSIFFALNLKREIVPDEAVHINLSTYYATTIGIPADTPETYRYNSIQHKPYLYYWLNGRLLNLVNLILPDMGSWKTLVTLRLTNVLYAALSVLFCYLLAKELGLSVWWRLFVIFMLTNTLMFVFLAGGVNYDNLVNLCSFAGIYYLIRVVHRKSFYPNTFGWMVWIMIGTLVKISVLPLAAILALIWVVWVLQNRSQIAFKPMLQWQTIVLSLVFAALLVLNFMIYGVNLLKYRAVVPSCTVLLTQSQCQQNPVFVRDQQVYLADKLSLVDMFNGNVPDPFVWFDQYWFGAMLKMTFGAIGHRVLDPSDLAITFYRLWIFWILILAIRFWQKPQTAFRVLALIVLGYTLVLLQTNLSSELNTGFKHIGIQGRYIFPVIGGFYILIASILAGVPNRILTAATVISTMVIFIINSPLWILSIPAPVQFPSGNISPEAHTIRISDRAQVSQDFRSECLGAITQVEVLFSAGNTSAAYPVSFQLVDTSSQTLITQQTVTDIPIGEATWLAFPLSIQGSIDHPYRIILKTSGGEQDTYLTLWHTKTNVYRGGDAIVAGVATNSDLVFRYTCRMPLLADWFN